MASERWYVLRRKIVQGRVTEGLGGEGASSFKQDGWGRPSEHRGDVGAPWKESLSSGERHCLSLCWVCTSFYLKSVLGDTGPSRPQLHLPIQLYHVTKKDGVIGTAVAPGTAWECLPSSWPSALSFAIGCCLVLALHTFYSNEPSKKPPSLGLCPLLAGSSG